MSVVDTTAAPAFMAPTPPDSVQLTLGEHLQAAAAEIQQKGSTATLTDADMAQIKTFGMVVQQVVMGLQAAQQQQAPQPGGPPNAADPNDPNGAVSNDPSATSDYGSGQGTPVNLQGY